MTKALLGIPKGKIALSTPGLVHAQWVPCSLWGELCQGPWTLWLHALHVVPLLAQVPSLLGLSDLQKRSFGSLCQGLMAVVGEGETLKVLFPTVSIQYFSLVLLFPCLLLLPPPMYQGLSYHWDDPHICKLTHQTFYGMPFHGEKVKGGWGGGNLSFFVFLWGFFFFFGLLL